MSDSSTTNSFIAPVGNETITVEEPYQIKWAYYTDGPVRIQLYYNDGDVYQNLTDSTENSGLYTWTPESRLTEFNKGINFYLILTDIPTKAWVYTPNGRLSFVAPSSSSSSISSDITTPTSTSETFVTSATATSSPTSSTPASTGLSADGKIAIGAVIPVCALVILGIAFFLMWRRRQKLQRQQPLMSGTPKQREETYPGRMHEIDGYAAPMNYSDHVSDSTEFSSTKYQPHLTELPAERWR